MFVNDCSLAGNTIDPVKYDLRALTRVIQENGPCTFNGAGYPDGNTSEPELNPYSWNEYANMLYVDQPIGTGFSYGTDDVVGTVSAAPAVWKLLQAFFAAFPVYECRDFGLFTESYGGHYGPGKSRDLFEPSWS